MKRVSVQQLLSQRAPLSPLSSRPERTRISYFALLATTTYAALRRESRMQSMNATTLDRKSGGAQWRGLCADVLSWKCFDRMRSEVAVLSVLRRESQRQSLLSVWDGLSFRPASAGQNQR